MKIISVNVSEKKGTTKQPVSEIIIAENGIVNDAHSTLGHRQVSFLDQSSIDNFSNKLNDQQKLEFARKFLPGEFAENITTEGLDVKTISLFDKIIMGDALLEVSQIGKKCHNHQCAIKKEVGLCVMPTDGFFGKVIRGGVVRPGMTIQIEKSPIKIAIVTVSDRAFVGEYEDLSGKELNNTLVDHFNKLSWLVNYEKIIVPDREINLQEVLNKMITDAFDVVITTGGTGVGPKDITPDVVEKYCRKYLSGIMENIRFKYGRQNPFALLSRGIAGVMGDKTLIFTLPGSINAVKEYMSEILPLLEHLLIMIRGYGH